MDLPAARAVQVQICQNRKGYDMLLYADSANIGRLRQMDELGIMSGITTNPVIAAREGKPALEVIASLCAAFPDYPVFAQVTGPSPEDMASQAECFAAVSPRVVVKIPACEAGLRAIAALRRGGRCKNELCATTVLTAAQALLASMAGADYVAPYVGDITALGFDGPAVLADIVAALKSGKTKVLAAAMERAEDIVTAAKTGADILTVSPEAARNVFLKPQPLTQWYLDLFENNAK